MGKSKKKKNPTPLPPAPLPLDLEEVWRWDFPLSPTPPPLDSEEVWRWDFPLSPLSESPAPSTPIHQTHSPCPSTLAQGFLVEDSFTFPRSQVGSVKPVVTFGSIDSASASISSSPAPIPAIESKGVKPCETVSATPTGHVNGKASKPSRTWSELTTTTLVPSSPRTWTSLAATSPSSSVWRAATSVPASPTPIPAIDSKGVKPSETVPATPTGHVNGKTSKPPRTWTSLAAASSSSSVWRPATSVPASPTPIPAIDSKGVKPPKTVPATPTGHVNGKASKPSRTWASLAAASSSSSALTAATLEPSSSSTPPISPTAAASKPELDIKKMFQKRSYSPSSNPPSGSSSPSMRNTDLPSSSHLPPSQLGDHPFTPFVTSGQMWPQQHGGPNGDPPRSPSYPRQMPNDTGPPPQGGMSWGGYYDYPNQQPYVYTPWYPSMPTQLQPSPPHGGTPVSPRNPSPSIAHPTTSIGSLASPPPKPSSSSIPPDCLDGADVNPENLQNTTLAQSTPPQTPPTSPGPLALAPSLMMVNPEQLSLIPADRLPGADMNLDEFCAAYCLTDRVRKKLDDDGYCGTHTFQYVEWKDLREAGLKNGEIAQLKHAISKWSVPPGDGRG